MGQLLAGETQANYERKSLSQDIIKDKLYKKFIALKKALHFARLL
jgi:hypothetical protein